MADLLGPDPAPPSPVSAEGHRERLRARLLEGEALPDHELLELLLFLALPRRDTKPLARALLAQFGSLRAVLDAPVPRLQAFAGLGPAGVAALKAMQAVMRRAGGA